MANSVDSDETSGSAAFHLRLHFLLRAVCQITYSKYGTSRNCLSIFTEEKKIRKNVSKCFLLNLPRDDDGGVLHPINVI